jgi:hypothetical protein
MFGYNGGDSILATATTIAQPAGVLVDKDGNIVFSEYSDTSLLRKINMTTGILTTIAGRGTITCPPDGTLASMVGFGPVQTLGYIGRDNAGNIYVPNCQCHKIYKIDTNLIVTTVVGTGVSGWSGENGLATAANISCPIGVATDKKGNLYFADHNALVIGKVDTAGIMTRFAGTPNVSGSSGNGGLATNATFADPLATEVAVDKNGNIYICDLGNYWVRKIDTFGIINVIAGNGTNGNIGDSGSALSAEIGGVEGIAVDCDENVYIADEEWYTIRKIDTSGIITTVVGNGVDSCGGDGGPPLSASLASPTGITFGPDGTLYICDWRNNKIRMVTNATNICPLLSSVNSVQAKENNVLIYPNPVQNDLTIQNAENSTIRIFDVVEREVYSGVIIQNKEVVNTNIFSSGTYIVEITGSSGERLIKKIVK